MSVEAPLEFVRPREPKPEWLKVRAPGSENYLRLKGIMQDLKAGKVCIVAGFQGINEAGQITTLGKGETDLLVKTGDNVREPQNRRAEIVLQ